jgi:hypothetical protein
MRCIVGPVCFLHHGPLKKRSPQCTVNPIVSHAIKATGKSGQLCALIVFNTRKPVRPLAKDATRMPNLAYSENSGC